MNLWGFSGPEFLSKDLSPLCLIIKQLRLIWWRQANVNCEEEEMFLFTVCLSVWQLTLEGGLNACVRLSFSNKSLLHSHRAIQAFSLQAWVTVELMLTVILQNLIFLKFLTSSIWGLWTKSTVWWICSLCDYLQVHQWGLPSIQERNNILVLACRDCCCATAVPRVKLCMGAESSAVNDLNYSSSWFILSQGLSHQSLGCYQETRSDMPVFWSWLGREPLLHWWRGWSWEEGERWREEVRSTGTGPQAMAGEGCVWETEMSKLKKKNLPRILPKTENFSRALHHDHTRVNLWCSSKKAYFILFCFIFIIDSTFLDFVLQA